MKKKINRLTIAFLACLFISSCNEPDTVVTDVVHPDGSVTRMIEMKSIEKDISKRFRISEIQVPFGNDWNIKDSVELDDKGDTIFVRHAEKFFKNIEAINREYKTDSGSNKHLKRSAGFTKKFKWFNTEYRFSERIERKLSYGYPARDFLNEEEMHYFYSPESLKNNETNGPDSLKYKTLSDSVKSGTDRWTARNVISGWIKEFTALTAGKGDESISEKALKSKEEEMSKQINFNTKDGDSLFIFRNILGNDNAVKFRAEADSALKKVVNQILEGASEYSLRIEMPGKLIGTNGFVDKNKVLLWPVKSDYFLTEPYLMWAESKETNKWAWILSGIFLLFVLTGVLVRIFKKP